MYITSTLDIKKKKNGTWEIEFNGNSCIVDESVGENLINELSYLYNRVQGGSPTRKEAVFEDMKNDGKLNTLISLIEGKEEELNATLTDEELVKRGIQNLMDFFTEFSFEPNFRFVNSIALKKSTKDRTEYIKDYFRLLDNPYVSDIEMKMKSKEFKQIMTDFDHATPTNRINTRFKVYYGSAGTGKTTMAQKETDGRCIVCNNSMFPSDIMEDFVFVDGNPSFNPSIFWECMEQGKTIVLDEINLLPFDTLRFLQGLLDGKTSFDYKGRKVEIKEGFGVIGTMNLTIGGAVFGLPEPLVDRSSDFKEFKLSAEQLMKAIQ